MLLCRCEFKWQHKSWTKLLLLQPSIQEGIMMAVRKAGGQANKEDILTRNTRRDEFVCVNYQLLPNLFCCTKWVKFLKYSLLISACLNLILRVHSLLAPLLDAFQIRVYSQCSSYFGLSHSFFLAVSLDRPNLQFANKMGGYVAALDLGRSKEKEVRGCFLIAVLDFERLQTRLVTHIKCFLLLLLP